MKIGIKILIKREEISKKMSCALHGAMSYHKISFKSTQKKGKLLPIIEKITVGKAHGNLIKIFWWSQPSFSIRRE